MDATQHNQREREREREREKGREWQLIKEKKNNKNKSLHHFQILNVEELLLIAKYNSL